VGVDIAPTFIEMARRSVPAGEFHVMSVTSLQFENSSFDGVWCSCVLIHLSKKDTAVAIGEMFRVLKPGGVLYILVKAGESEGYEADSRYEGMKKYSSYFTEDELRHLLEGFQIISVTSVDKPVDLYRAPDRIFVLARKPQV
jgi:ubiquinone/menaquinone biosynthesis C-methylase UbiE